MTHSLTRRRLVPALLLAGLLGGLPGALSGAAAQAYPSRPVKLIVPLTATQAS